jgi:hypothetical protein
VPFAVGAACAVVLGLYLVACFAIVQLGDLGACTTHGPPSDPSAPATGQLSWRWIPPALECTWAVDDQGHEIGPPRESAPTTTRRVGGAVGGWGMAGLAIVVFASFAIAYLPARQRDDRVERDDAVRT